MGCCSTTQPKETSRVHFHLIPTSRDRKVTDLSLFPFPRSGRHHILQSQTELSFLSRCSCLYPLHSMPCASSPTPGIYGLASVHSLNMAPAPSLASGLATPAPSAACSSWGMPCLYAFADTVLSTWNLLLCPLPDKFPPIHPLKPELGPCHFPGLLTSPSPMPQACFL